MKLDKIKGTIFGVATGDALGVTVETLTPEEIQNEYGTHKEITGGGWLRCDPGEASDDTAMTVCLANSLIECQGYDVYDAADKYVGWMNTNPIDIGYTTITALMAVKNGKSPVASGLPAPTASNGSAMRCSPIGIFYWKDAKKRQHYSKEDSSITHANQLCISACVLVNELISLALQGKTLQEMQKQASELSIDGRLTGALHQPTPLHKPTGYILDTLRAAFYALFTSKTFEETLIKAVNMGGDADTIGAIAGAIAGAYYGFESIPKRWTKKITIKKELEKISKGLFELVK
ncbi:MAG: ADP-ribosylglycohydrolase family protein [Candidatus Woesearchaeota archaeon]|nr:ADP-ribosylglycohydrolase family protein [Candidatus Woesearchaeota archaeon]